MTPSAVDLFLEVLVEYHGEEACGEVRLDAVVPPHEHRPGLEVGLCDAEAVLYYPSSSVRPDDRGSIILLVGAYAADAVEAGLLFQLSE